MFDVYTVSQIIAGNKTVTRRMYNGRRPAVPETIHKLKIDRTQNTYGMIRILDCRVESLSELTDEDAIKEGFNDKEHYLKYFKYLNGDVKMDTLVWRVEFELV